MCQVHSVYGIYGVYTMKKVLVSGRIPQAHRDQLTQIMGETGKNESEIVREAIAHYLGETPPDSVTQMALRLTIVENRLVKMQKLFLGEE